MKNKIKYDEQFNADIAETLKECRKNRRYSLRQAGALVGVSGQCLKYYESGRSPISLPVFFALTKAMEYDPIEVLVKIQKKSG